jgi:threo-3-hydroxy-L-aspartate ammonia-lyase
MSPTPIGLPISYSDIVLARARIAGAANKTPVMTSRTADRMTGARLFFKCENFQRTGSFKFRGAFNAIAALPEENRQRGVVTFSSGNHAQAIAFAGRLQRVAATIVMPKDAPEIKIRATTEYGGNIVFYDRYTEDREAIARRLASEVGLSLIPPYDHPQVAAGQGTATSELLEEIGPLDRLFVPLGGGGLLAGAALSAHELSAGCKVVGVEPEAGNDGQQSLRAGHVISIPAPRSLADGALTTHLGAATFPVIKSLVTDIVTVKDPMLVETMRFFAERMKIVAEPTACLAAAAVFSNRFHQPGERVGVLISGGNVDIPRFCQMIAE